jgi:hypothetical protein
MHGKILVMGATLAIAATLACSSDYGRNGVQAQSAPPGTVAAAQAAGSATAAAPGSSESTAMAATGAADTPETSGTAMPANGAMGPGMMPGGGMMAGGGMMGRATGRTGATGAGATTAAAPADSACPPVAPALIKAGKSIFTGSGNCSTCHGPSAQGTPLAPTLHAHKWLNIDGSYESIAGLITTGVPNPKQHPAPMPPKGGANLNRQQVCEVAAYVYSLSH